MRVSLIIPPMGGLAMAAQVVEALGPDVARDVELVWAGDPHGRPAAPAGARWIDLGLAEPSGVGWNRLLIAMAPPVYAVTRGARAAAAAVERDHTARLLLHVGQIAVLNAGQIAALIPASGIAAIDRSPSALAPDGLAPTAADLLTHGSRSGAALAIAADGGPDAHQLADVLIAGAATDHVGPLLDAAAEVVEIPPLPRALAAGWSVSDNDADLPAVVDIGAVDADRLHSVRFGARAPRVRMSRSPNLARAIASSSAQWRTEAAAKALPEGSPDLPGGVVADAVIRRLMNDAIERWRRGEAELPPDPFGADASGFLEWLESPWPPWRADIGRYWNGLYDVRPDLFAAFPEPAGTHYDSFVTWAQERWRHERTSPLVRAVGNHMRPPWADVGTDPSGVNLIGYLAFDKSLGDVARRLESSLAAADVAHGSLHYHRSGSPLSADAPPLTEELRYATNVVVVNADQFPLLDADYGDVLWPAGRGRRTIGYWFWDIAYIPQVMVETLRFIDELWVATEFAANAFRAVTDKPVRIVDIPVPQPVASGVTRAELGLPDDRFVFLVTLDHLSVTERKNPVAAVRAFCKAFPTTRDDGPVMVVKTVNASQRWAEHDAILLAAAGRDDIIVIDRHVTRGDQMAYTAHADCLVSLHRAEGLGLHLMEAMWLGTPTIATRYSGNLQFMNDDNSLLVDYELVGVQGGEGYFPEEGEWAEPDVAQAAAIMRRLVDDPDLRVRLAEAGLASMGAQPTLADAGGHISQVLSLRPAVAAVAGSAVP
ncbi:MAG TPA: glycosyltransferase [Ilumatobacter sp.]|nr:glycosyltransferase [Ilumatobacter sp.]